MRLEKLIMKNPISDFFTETFDLLSAGQFENLVFRPQSQGGKICQAGPGILSGTFEPPRFGKAPKGKPKEDKAKGILSGTYEPPKSLHLVADSGPAYI